MTLNSQRKLQGKKINLSYNHYHTTVNGNAVDKCSAKGG